MENGRKSTIFLEDYISRWFAGPWGQDYWIVKLTRDLFNFKEIERGKEKNHNYKFSEVNNLWNGILFSPAFLCHIGFNCIFISFLYYILYWFSFFCFVLFDVNITHWFFFFKRIKYSVLGFPFCSFYRFQISL